MNGPNVLKRVLCTAVLLTLLLVQGSVAAGASPAPTGAGVNDFHMVTNTNDSGAGSLRQAIADASAGDWIQFLLAYPATIILTSGELLIDKELTIDGPGAQRLTISGNQASRVFNISSSGTDVVISGLTVAFGWADWGGGINNAGTLTVNRVWFASNCASYGGGIENAGGTLTVNNSTFSGNPVWVSGGGIDNGGGTLTVTNSTFSANDALADGGGIENYGGTMTLTNVTFSNNVANRGGGIDNWGGTLNLRSTIIANSTGGDCANSGTIGQNVANLVEDGSCSPAYSGDPNLGPLGDYGGDTPTHALLSPSPAIDHGDPGTCPLTDQRGFQHNGPCDIGAFEYGGCLLLVTVVSSADSGPGTLRQAIADACPGGTIDFYLAPRATITLTSGQLAIEKDLTILGPGAQDLTVSGNHASRVFYIGGSETDVVISGLTIADGYATGSGGGGIANGGGTLTVSHVVLSGNEADWGGGGIENGVLRPLTVNNSTFSRNRAGGDGGGIENAGGTLTVNNSTFSRNTAEAGGGIDSYAGTVTLNNTTFSGNMSNGGPGLFGGGGILNGFGGTLNFANTIIANSTAGDCVLWGGGTIGQNVCNLVEDGSCSPAYSGDPHLAPLGDYGGDTRTHAIISPSQAIDHGDPATCIATDQRGAARYDGDNNGSVICDIGAYEYDGWQAAHMTFLPLVLRNE